MVSPRRRKATQLNESGQAVIEYVLVLCVTVMLIGSLLYRFSTAFRTYANNFFGDYVACLLETGELPGNASCSAEFKAFNLADGKTSSGGSGGGDGSGGSGSGSSGNSGSGSGGKNGNGSKSGGTGKSGSSKSNSANDGNGSGSSSGSGGETVGLSGSGTGGAGFGKRSSTRLGSSSKVAGVGKDAAGKPRAGLTAIASVSNSNSSGGDARGRRTALSRGFQYYGQEEDQEKEESRPATKAVAKDESSALKPKKVAEPPPRAPASKYDGDQGGFSLGGLIRILLIAGIVVAIFILFGGQILAISKSGEK